MRTLQVHRLLEFLTAGNLLVGVLWLGLAVLTVLLLALMWTRWGQSRPLRKCLVLSLLAHLLMAGYASTVHIVAALPAGWGEPLIRVSIGGAATPPAEPTAQSAAQETPWNVLVHDLAPDVQPSEPARQQLDDLPEPQHKVPLKPASLEDAPRLAPMASDDAAIPDPQLTHSEVPTPKPVPEKTAEPIVAPGPQRREAPELAAIRPEIEERPPIFDAETLLLPTPLSGVPSALLEYAPSAPHIAAEVATPDPASSLLGLTDTPSDLPRGKPAETTLDASVPSKESSSDSEQSAQASPGRATMGAKADSGASTSSADATAAAEAGSSGQHHDANWQPPAIYQLRGAGDRSTRTRGQGCTAQSEAAVTAALAWLAANQAPDGRWDASDHGAGRETMTDGQNRQHAGAEADTGITGLSILAFLASGHTHRTGAYQENVERGISFLVQSQAANGNLGGPKASYAAMYCHAIATFALSEAYGMTGDEQLRRPVERALRYTIAAQDTAGGGWRYQPGDSGDTSQLGWQLMVIKSAELAGIRTPSSVHQNAIRFLRSVSSGPRTGLAGYRPGQPATRPMTAEAMVCKQFVGMTPDGPAMQEAADYLMGELPGAGRANFYYWYYATLGLYQVQDPRWEQWNKALQDALVKTQQTAGDLAGSWDPDPVWGGYGGRVYNTALGALCLEVYYRYLPLYTETSSVLKPVR